ncbi:MAG TPA: outer membrane beta-barrel protein [Candidatus Limisoma intestinavium]|uniref:Outer membrane beta-barrel protein n=1 Tax=Candidatus Limisoma intestinavium TaxID=2840856 RepID=A0A9D1LHT5_9BACT|nr:outer membrane beta-barrel protein [Candidatus Limisoma intestinavium]
MRKNILLLSMSLLATTTAMAGEPWQNGFSVGVEGNFSITNSDNSNLNNAEAFNDFKGTAISGSYTAFLAKGLFVRPQISVYYEDHDAVKGLALGGLSPETIDLHASETGVGFAVFAGYRIPAGKLSVDLFTGPYYSIAIDQHETYERLYAGDSAPTVSHDMNQFNTSSLRWRFGVGLNVWRLTISASFDIGVLKIDSNLRESNVAGVGIGYNF